jgi:hypothetical protein
MVTVIIDGVTVEVPDEQWEAEAVERYVEPLTFTKENILDWLDQNGKLADFEARLAAATPRVRQRWYAKDAFLVNDPDLIKMAIALGLDPSQLDTLKAEPEP